MNPTGNREIAAPPSDLRIPAAWYLVGRTSDLRAKPRSLRLGRREYVAFRTESGGVAVLDGRCVHMGAQLSLGCVVGDRLRCPFHAWEFDRTGRCVAIPATPGVPAFARQRAYPTSQLGDFAFFYPDDPPAFELPFFDGKRPTDLFPSRPFEFDLELPWYLIAANGFDIQHFRTAHDRTLVDEPVVTQPSPFCRRIRGKFAVTGTGVRDRLTRTFSGPEVTMTVSSWCGVMILVTAEFRRTTSYGMVCVEPVTAGRTRLRTIIWVPRSRGAVGRAALDPADAWVRRSFIRAFMKSDADRSAGIRYTPGTLIEADRALRDYLQWVLSVPCHVQG